MIKIIFINSLLLVNFWEIFEKLVCFRIVLNNFVVVKVVFF